MYTSPILDAGKDVYLEKPMSHSLEESAKIVEAVRRTKQVWRIWRFIGTGRFTSAPTAQSRETV